MLVDTLLRDGILPERNLSHSPLFQAALSLQNVPVPVRELPGLALEPVNLDKGIAGYDMLLQVTETPEGLACAWEYNSDLFDAGTSNAWPATCRRSSPRPSQIRRSPSQPYRCSPVLNGRRCWSSGTRRADRGTWNARSTAGSRTMPAEFQARRPRFLPSPAAGRLRKA